jgi:WD40 repeat protein
LQSKEAVCASNVPDETCFLVSDDDYICSFCSLCFSKLNKTYLPLTPSNTDDKNEILSLKVSRDQRYFAMIAGKNMIKGLEELNQILVYEIISKTEFKMVCNHTLDEEYFSYSKNFDFCYRDDNPEGDGNSLLILSRQKIKRFDYRK